MNYSDDVLKAAHKHCTKHRTEVKGSEICSCFSCRSTFEPAEIADWIDELIDNLEGEDTALCPKCGIDSVIGAQSGYPVASPDFLNAMHAYWFERTVYVKYPKPHRRR